MNTKKEIVDRIYFILGEDQTSDVFDKEGEVVPKIKEVIDSICRCKVTNLNTGMDINGGLLDFLYKEKTLKIPRSKRLMYDINEDSTSIELSDTDGLDTNGGYIEINGNIISYGTINGTTLSNLTGINGYHEAKCSLVNYVYIMPETLIKVYDIFDINWRRTLKFIDFREREPRCGRSYTIKPHNGRKAIIFFNAEGSMLLTYSVILPEMEDDEDECGFPDDYGLKIIPNLVVGELLVDTSENEKGKQLLQLGYNALEDMYQFYATPSKPFRKKIGTRPMFFR